MNGKYQKLLKDEETRSFYKFIIVVVLIVTAWVYFNGFEKDLEEAFRNSLFQVSTLISTTGFATIDYLAWGPFFWLISLLLMVVCGCAGSTCGGLKMGRVVILTKVLFNECKKQTHPKAIVPVRMNGLVLSGDIIHQVLAFTFIYLCVLLFSCLVLMADGIGFEESLGAVVSALGNVGPGLGSCGPVGNYADFPVLSKWVLSFVMMTGRLEIFTVFTILLPSFWKQ